MRKLFSKNRPLVMGILNVTPDSFSDGGAYFLGADLDRSVEMAVARALEMIKEGADIIDVGGESTGPGSSDVSLEEELGRVIPVIEGIRAEEERRSIGRNVLISVDTWKSEVAEKAIEAGATMVNDVTAFRGDPEMARVVADARLEGGARVPVVLMYSKDEGPRTSKENVKYTDVVAAIKEFLMERVKVAEKAGVSRDQIILDPGMGAFVSMDPEYSYEILARLEEFKDLGFPILVGTSRKSFLTTHFGDMKPEDRLEGSLSTAFEAKMNGASILRVHDVAETRQMH